ncbi:CaiB/BaiF CoA-transferase family protein [Paracoccus sp. S1E-3]|uniref:CaiB/BaiF CoA transferase family protein n=1 Tax=Paracoccus sp. S1E-3 TaxID=2756130 RepID=UPI0015EE6F1F|nr:CaiB/BaiF CoA-transferase family protein [Paracoccus sp. S1E-3]MBA4490051.1 CoA transferase [Paracoccus sp. S1E-3]
MDNRPLAGLLVVSVEQAVAAPYCTSRLADAGARVLKIERPEGDFARGYDRAAAGESSYFVWLNRGKESVALDLGAPADRALFLSMTDRADVFVQNLKPGTLERKGLGSEALRARNPRLITCAISGYGETGPYAARKAYDLLIQAESGLCSVTGGPEAPARVGISVVDIATGAAAQAAILEALLARGRAGQGCDIRISMFDVIADWLAVPFLHAAAGQPPQRIGLAHPSISPYGVFTTADGQDLLISIQNDREWATFAAKVLKKPALAQHPDFATNTARVAHRAAVDAEVAAVIGRHDKAAMGAILQAADIAFAGVNDMAGLMSHPHLSTIAVTTPGAISVPLPAPPARFDGQRHIGAAPAPALDQHGAAIRAEFAAPVRSHRA